MLPVVRPETINWATWSPRGINGFYKDPSDRGTELLGRCVGVIKRAEFDNQTELSRIRRQPRLFGKCFILVI